MIEILPKISGLFKTIGFSLFMISSTSSITNKIKKKERKLAVDDDVPGDNFPYVVMNSGYSNKY